MITKEQAALVLKAVNPAVYEGDELTRDLARTVIALWDRVDRLTSAGIDAATQLRVIAGMDLICASAVAYNAVRPLEAILKETTHD